MLTLAGRGQAVMVVADKKQSLTITGNGDVLEPHDGVIGARRGSAPASHASTTTLFHLPICIPCHLADTTSPWPC